MTVSENRNIAIVGVGSSMSKSLAMWLANLGWNIAPISRSEQSLSAITEEVKRAQEAKDARVVYRTADAGDAASLKATLDWCVEQLGGKLDVLNYNAARVAGSDITTTPPDMFELDFRVLAVGTLVTGQWFTDDNARTDRVAEKGEWPLFLVTGAVLDKEPDVSLASLCTAKAASQTVSRLFAQVLPEKNNILVGMPLVTGRIVNPETGEYYDEFHPDKIIQKLFKPFFEDRENREVEWTVERHL